MAAVSDNQFPKVVLTEQGSTPSNPASGDQKFYIRTSDHKPCLVNSSGTVTVLSTGGSGMSNDGWIDKTAETWTYASADAPTFTFTISGDLTGTYQAGQRIKLTQTTVKYFIVTAVSYGAPNTTVTIYGGTDYTLTNAAISVNYYSPVKAPLGFPLDVTKWTVEVTDTSNRVQASPTNGTWYNPGSVSISIPIGHWRVCYNALLGVSMGASGAAQGRGTLSTANNSQSDADFTTEAFGAGTAVAGDLRFYTNAYVEKYISLATKTPYYLNAMAPQGSTVDVGFRNDLKKCIIRAVCAYL